MIKIAKLLDLVGQTFGDWTVISYSGGRQWLCKCSCGEIKNVDGNKLRNGKSKSCGHGTTAFKDIVGSEFGEWRVIKEAKGGYYYCECSCGIIREVSKYHLLSGRTKSCGHKNSGGFTAEGYIAKNKKNLSECDRLREINVGDIVGEWEIIRNIENSYWKCKCSCGKESSVHDWNLKTGRSMSCGHSKDESLNGKKFGDWEVLEYSGKSQWKCRCSCGEIRNVRKTDLITGASKSCGHRKYDLKNDLTGRKFGCLHVKRYIGNGFYMCECDCGNITNVLSTNLMNNGTQSCGCKQATKYTKEYIIEVINNYVENNGEKPFRVDLANTIGIHVGYTSRLLNKYEILHLVNTELRSSYERELCDYIRKINPDTEIITNSKSIINRYELDIYIPDINLAIEFNGDYWHSEGNKELNYHQNKTILCAKNGIQLIHIFEYEWLDISTKNKLKNIIKDKLQKGSSKVVYARNCIIQKVGKEDEAKFLIENHLQNYSRSNEAYGLYYKDELVSIMTFGAPRFNTEHKLELIRYCNKMGVAIVGGAEKLFKHAVNQIKPKSIITYCNIAKFNGGVYSKLGFKATKNDITKPNYVWVGNGEVLSRYNTQKQKLVDAGLEIYGNTEDEIMINRGYVKIHDSGNLRLVWTCD